MTQKRASRLFYSERRESAATAGLGRGSGRTEEWESITVGKREAPGVPGLQIIDVGKLEEKR